MQTAADLERVYSHVRTQFHRRKHRQLKSGAVSICLMFLLSEQHTPIMRCVCVCVCVRIEKYHKHILEKKPLSTYFLLECETSITYKFA